MFISIVILPLLGFIFSSLFGFLIGRGSTILSTGSTLVACLLSIKTFFILLNTGSAFIVQLCDWVSFYEIKIYWSFLFDKLTGVMLFVVTFISTLVHLYSVEYMSEDPHLPRFMSYLSLFTFFMLILVTSNNFLQMFVGWEGVGLSSFLLINFWFTRIQANKAAMKAMLVNRVGDFFILLSIFTILVVTGSLEYDVVFSLSPSIINLSFYSFGYEFYIIDFICLTLFLGAMGKSAQLGLHTWLPDAMEGPTPVSALIHAATMVTAGVFLIARCSSLFELSPSVLIFIQFIGSCTATFAASTGLLQNDMKKVIAYSTCSQLGYMVFAAGMSSYDVSVFHLSNHAFFKALLFLGAGSVIHGVGDEQDMRKMGGLKNLMPFSYSVILIGSLALIGFPFLAGFYSKDVILEVAASKLSPVSLFCFYLGTLSALFTAFYSTRLLFLVFLSEPNGNKISIFNAHEPSWKMALPLFLLSFFSLSVGFYTHDIFIGLGTDFWDYSITILSENYSVRDIEFIPSITKLTPLFFTLLGTFLSYFIYSYFLNNFFELKNFALYRIFHNFFSRKWYFDRIYNQVFSKNILSISLYQYYINFDRGILEHVGPLGVAFSTEKLSSSIISLQNGNVRSYLEFLVFTFFYFCFFYSWYLGLNNPFETFFIFSSLFLLHLFFNLKKF